MQVLSAKCGVSFGGMQVPCLTYDTSALHSAFVRLLIRFFNCYPSPRTERDASSLSGLASSTALLDALESLQSAALSVEGR